MDVSIIIVNYNTSKFLKNCLLSIYEHTKNIEFEVIVSDNGSSDDSLDMIKTYFLKVLLITVFRLLKLMIRFEFYKLNLVNKKSKFVRRKKCRKFQ